MTGLEPAIFDFTGMVGGQRVTGILVSLWFAERISRRQLTHFSTWL